ncbi:MAG: hypothetical protein ACE5GE_01865 [Phycisphaerae bacterium]
MVWLLAVESISTRLLNTPFTETFIEGAHSLVYSPGVEPVKFAGLATPQGPIGTFGRGLHRASGVVFSFDGDAAEKLMAISAPIEVTARYLTAQNLHRKRRLSDVVFVGDATVTVPPLNRGVGPLIGVPFRVNIPQGDTLANHILDESD